MKISLDAIELLDAIDLAGSFAGAALRLDRVPSAVTHAVRKLESDLGVRLFERDGRRAELGPAGRVLLQEGRQLLRAAGEIEQRIHQTATGWESELRIAVDAAFEPGVLFPLVPDFDGEAQATRLRFMTESVGGGWDALVAGRADLVVGASGEAPPGRWASVPIGVLDLVFAVASSHPLAQLPEPLAAASVAQHRAIVLADSSRVTQGRMWGLAAGQDTLTVPDLPGKLAAQLAGLGVGDLPRWVAKRMAAEGRLVIKQLAEPMAPVPLFLAWRNAGNKPAGRALSWFVERLTTPTWLARLRAACGARSA
jgi:DNA-binding transcriptional LysR family regulator